MGSVFLNRDECIVKTAEYEALKATAAAADKPKPVAKKQSKLFASKKDA